MDLQSLINQAWELKKSGKHTEALALYSKAFDILTTEASNYAHRETRVSPLSTKINPDIFQKSKEYFKQDKVACTVSNNMAVIFAELGDLDSAERFFEQAIELTPDGIEYNDPRIGLEELKK